MPTAVAEFGGKEIFLHKETVPNILSGEDQNTIVHETGHTAWLVHPNQDYYSDPRNKISAPWQVLTRQKFNVTSNAMHSNPMDSWTNINRVQFMALYTAMLNGMVNRASVDKILDNVR